LKKEREKVEAGWAKPIREPGAGKLTRHEQGRQDVIAALLDAYVDGKGTADLIDVFADMLTPEQGERFNAAATR
jgi:hypothetical protein